MDFLTNHQLILIAIVVGVMVLGAGGMLLTKKFGTSFVSVAGSIVAFIKLKMDEAGFSNKNFDTVMDFVLQALSYVQAISSTETTSENKAMRAYEYVEGLLAETAIKLTAEEADTIKAILKCGFIFMDLVGMDSSKVSTKNYMKLYKGMTDYSGQDVQTIVGLRKTLK